MSESQCQPGARWIVCTHRPVLLNPRRLSNCSGPRSIPAFLIVLLVGAVGMLVVVYGPGGSGWFAGVIRGLVSSARTYPPAGA